MPFFGKGLKRKRRRRSKRETTQTRSCQHDPSESCLSDSLNNPPLLSLARVPLLRGLLGWIQDLLSRKQTTKPSEGRERKTTFFFLFSFILPCEISFGHRRCKKERKDLIPPPPPRSGGVVSRGPSSSVIASLSLFPC